MSFILIILFASRFVLCSASLNSLSIVFPISSSDRECKVVEIMYLPLLILSTSSFLYCTIGSDEVAFRINEKLSTDVQFFNQWKDLISTQERQIIDHSDDLLHFTSLVQSLHSCGRVKGVSDNVDSLRLNDISIFTDLGHLSTFCRHNLTRLNNGDLDSCGHHSSSSDLPTIDKLIRVFNPNLTVVNLHRKHGQTFSNQVKDIAFKIKEIPGYEDKWKFIMMLPNIQDGEASETGQAAIEVLQGIEYLAEHLPKRTFIVVLKNIGKGIWRDASHAHSACLTLLDRWKRYVDHNTESVWEQVDMIVQKNFQNSDFAVELIPLLNDAALAQLPNGTDLSALGYDCAHWSERGLSILHESIWNTLLTSTNLRSKEYRPVHSRPVCPDPRCPFVRTASNSNLCIWNPLQDEPPSIAPQLIAFGILAVSALLCLILVLFLCLRKDKGQLKKEKTFGSNFSSIRFIDDDI